MIRLFPADTGCSYGTPYLPTRTHLVFMFYLFIPIWCRHRATELARIDSEWRHDVSCISTITMPLRLLQLIVNIPLRAEPSRECIERPRIEGDEVCESRWSEWVRNHKSDHLQMCFLDPNATYTQTASNAMSSRRTIESPAQSTSLIGMLCTVRFARLRCTYSFFRDNTWTFENS
ncbi:hypothetical protein CY34DRAFT_803904 [Suillus luteus UH-Slu-Lm8-n1]|uniref:Uncharacterized protein n=1 Tax=Suillus luteus UH-Slu-Lm8-n1 TaxID=930992 RepID=A0A0D0AZZ3_9AGAM|nr:hypothetical protein CY34DRAFT_803904 [Suillus luteus UH-Slu-Lm8-n1]